MSRFFQFIENIKDQVKDGSGAKIKAKIVKMLVNKIAVNESSFDIHFHCGEEYSRAIQGEGQMGAEADDHEVFNNQPHNKMQKETKKPPVGGSSTGQFGRGYRIRTDDIHLVRVALYQLS